MVLAGEGWDVILHQSGVQSVLGVAIIMQGLEKGDKCIWGGKFDF